MALQSYRKPSDYQFRTYKPGEFKSQLKQVVANIWDWDPDWKVEWFEDGKPKGPMQPFEDEDQDFITMKNGKAEGYHTRHLSVPNLPRRPEPSRSKRLTVFMKTTHNKSNYKPDKNEHLSKTIVTACLCLAALSIQAQTQVIAHRGYWKAEGSAQKLIGLF